MDENNNSFDNNPLDNTGSPSDNANEQPVLVSSTQESSIGESTPASNYYSNTNYTTTPEEPESKGFAIASLVMGILSILTCCCTPLELLLGILGIIFSCVQAKDYEGNKPTQATIGLILSIIGTVLAAGLIVFSIIYSSSSTYQNIFDQINSSVY